MMVVRARLLSRLAHIGQKDKSGAPYYTHPARVAEIVSRRYAYNDARQVNIEVASAYLHDTLEDTWVKPWLLRLLFPKVVVQTVQDLTRGKGEERNVYLARVKKNPWAVPVKFADMEDNTAPERLALLPYETRQRLLAKYGQSRRFLRQA